MAGDELPPVDNSGSEVVCTHDPTTGEELPRPAVAMTVGASMLEHMGWLDQRYADDDGLGYDRRRLAEHAATAHLARLRR